ncbi:hypothetical protein VTL71DRAFT_2733 [Oculimacula yallundae]|uniref:Myb-like DNA-binding domain-containing protein n=1 Tax=Oculimacula yallundae TaxID=86028 RepID=A0ABR4CBM0_9HELO
MAPASNEEQFKFLISCIRYSNNGKVDFTQVAKECKIVSKGAAAKRYERMMRAHGIASNAATVKPASVRTLKAEQHKNEPLLPPSSLSSPPMAKKRKADPRLDEFNDGDDEEGFGSIKVEPAVMNMEQFVVKEEDQHLGPGQLSLDDAANLMQYYDTPSRYAGMEMGEGFDDGYAGGYSMASNYGRGTSSSSMGGSGMGEMYGMSLQQPYEFSSQSSYGGSGMEAMQSSEPPRMLYRPLMQYSSDDQESEELSFSFYGPHYIWHGPQHLALILISRLLIGIQNAKQATTSSVLGDIRSSKDKIWHTSHLRHVFPFTFASQSKSANISSLQEDNSFIHDTEDHRTRWWERVWAEEAAKERRQRKEIQERGLSLEIDRTQRYHATTAEELEAYRSWQKESKAIEREQARERRFQRAAREAEEIMEGPRRRRGERMAGKEGGRMGGGTVDRKDVTPWEFEHERCAGNEGSGATIERKEVTPWEFEHDHSAVEERVVVTVERKDRTPWEYAHEYLAGGEDSGATVMDGDDQDNKLRKWLRKVLPTG